MQSKNVLSLFSDQVMKELEKFCAGTLVIPLTFFPIETDKQEINCLIDDINKSFEFYSSQIRSDIIANYQKCNIIRDEINQENVNAKLREIINIQNEIRKQVLELREIQSVLNPAYLKEVATFKYSNNPQKQNVFFMELRVSHLDAEKLTMFSDVVAVACDYLEEKIAQLKQTTIATSHIKQVEQIKDQLFQVQEGIIDTMKTRIEMDRNQQPSSLELSQLSLSTYSLGSDWQETKHAILPHSENNVDKTYSQAMPKLPIHSDFVFKNIPEYFLYYIAKVGGDLAWAEKYGYVENKILINRMTSYFSPKTNPYVGIGKDFWDYLSSTYFKSASEYITSMIDSMRGNWVAKNILWASERIQQNENYQKIQYDLAYKKDYFLEKFQILSEKFYEYYNREEKEEGKEAALKEYEQKIKMLADNWININMLTEFEYEIESIQNDVQQMQEKLDLEIMKYNNLCADYVAVNESTHEIILDILEADPIVMIGSDLTTLTMALIASQKNKKVILIDLENTIAHEILLNENARDYLISLINPEFKKMLDDIFLKNTNANGTTIITNNEIEKILLRQLATYSTFQIKQIIPEPNLKVANINYEFKIDHNTLVLQTEIIQESRILPKLNTEEKIAFSLLIDATGAFAEISELKEIEYIKNEISKTSKQDESSKKIVGVHAKNTIVNTQNNSKILFVNEALFKQSLPHHTLLTIHFDESQAFAKLLETHNQKEYQDDIEIYLSKRINEIHENKTLKTKVEQLFVDWTSDLEKYLNNHSKTKPNLFSSKNGKLRNGIARFLLNSLNALNKESLTPLFMLEKMHEHLSISIAHENELQSKFQIIKETLPKDPLTKLLNRFDKSLSNFHRLEINIPRFEILDSSEIDDTLSQKSMNQTL